MNKLVTKAGMWALGRVGAAGNGMGAVRGGFNRVSNFSRGYSYYRKRRPEYVYFNGAKQQGYSYRDYRNFWSNMSGPQRRVAYGLGGVVVVFLVTHVQEAPVTHRWRLMTTPEWIERIVTRSSFRGVMGEFGNSVLPESHPVSRQVAKVMVRLINAAHDYPDPETGRRLNLFTELGKADIPLDEWRFYVIDDVAMGRPTPNAFVIGGGKVFIFRSILPICEDEDGLATVLSHELGHLLADHLGEKLTLSPFLLTLNMAMYSIFGSSRPGDILVNALLDTSFSREMETEADYIGLMVMSRACYNPQKAPRLWQNMMKFERQNGQTPPELLSTHPSSDRRFRNISEWMPKAVAVYSDSGCQQAQGFNSLLGGFSGFGKVSLV